MEIACEVMRLYAPVSRRLRPEQQRRAAELFMDMPPAEDIRRERGHVLGCNAEWFIPRDVQSDTVIYYLHGGGYVLGSLRTHQGLINEICRASDARALGIDYRLSPEHPFPCALEDAVAGYRYLLSEGISPGRIVIMGESAGGGLTIATLLRLRALGLPQPAAAVAISPWVDLENESPSIRHHARSDWLNAAYLHMCAACVLGDTEPRHPLASPIYADLRGLPPLLVQVGGAELLLDDAIRLAARARDCGVEVHLDVHPEMVHVFHMFASFSPEARRAIRMLGAFVRERTAATRMFAAVAEE